MQTVIRRTIGMALLMALLVIGGCGSPQPAAQAPSGGSAAPSESPAAQPTAQPPAGGTVRLGYQPTVVYAPIYLAIERGYFANEGVTVELSQIQATQDAVVQLAAGNFDVAVAGGNAGVFNAIARGLKFKVVAPVHSERPPVATPLVISAKRTGEIKSIADLKGKTVAIVAPGAAIEYWVAQALAQGGLSINDVQLKAMPFPTMAAALDSGTVDAAVLTEPLVTINKDQGLITVLDDDFIDGFTATYVFMGQEWLEQNPQLARGFLKAYLQACRDLQGDYMTPELAAVIEKYTKVPAPVVQRAALAQYRADGSLPVENLETLQGFFLERGLLEYTDPLDVNSFVDTTLLAEVAGEVNK